MAPNHSHAAWQNERSFAVVLIPEEGRPTELAAGLTDFLEAVDLATDWLAREDPERTGTTGVAIFETRGDVREKVWEYPPPHAPAEQKKLVEVFGFDPVSWTPAGREFVPERTAPTPPPRRREPSAQPEAAPELEPDALAAPGKHRVRQLLRTSWDDGISRAALIAAALALWLAITLVDVRFLVLLVPAVAGLWWRRDMRAAAVAQAGFDDDFL